MTTTLHPSDYPEDTVLTLKPRSPHGAARLRDEGETWRVKRHMRWAKMLDLAPEWDANRSVWTAVRYENDPHFQIVAVVSVGNGLR